MIIKVSIFTGEFKLLNSIEKRMDKLLSNWENRHNEYSHEFIYVSEKEEISLKLIIYEKYSNSENSKEDCMGRENDRKRSF